MGMKRLSAKDLATFQENLFRAQQALDTREQQIRVRIECFLQVNLVRLRSISIAIINRILTTYAFHSHEYC